MTSQRRFKPLDAFLDQIFSDELFWLFNSPWYRREIRSVFAQPQRVPLIGMVRAEYSAAQEGVDKAVVRFVIVYPCRDGQVYTPRIRCWQEVPVGISVDLGSLSQWLELPRRLLKTWQNVYVTQDPSQPQWSTCVTSEFVYVAADNLSRLRFLDGRGTIVAEGEGHVLVNKLIDFDDAWRAVFPERVAFGDPNYIVDNSMPLKVVGVLRAHEAEWITRAGVHITTRSPKPWRFMGEVMEKALDLREYRLFTRKVFQDEEWPADLRRNLCELFGAEVDVFDPRRIYSL